MTDFVPEPVPPRPALHEVEAARLTRFVRVLKRQNSSAETMSGFFAGVGARGVVVAMATIAFGPRREDLNAWNELPELVRTGLHRAAQWPAFDAEEFGADLAALLADDDEQVRGSVSAVTSYLLSSGMYDPRLLAGWSRAYDAMTLPAERPLTWGTFLVGSDGERPWTSLAAVAKSNGRTPA